MDTKIILGLVAVAAVVGYVIYKKSNAGTSLYTGPGRPPALVAAEQAAGQDLKSIKDAQRRDFLTKCYATKQFSERPWAQVPSEVYERYMDETGVRGKTMSNETACNSWYDWPGRPSA